MQNSTSPTDALRPSLPRRFARWLFSWRAVRFCLVALAGLITLLALVWAEENWRGKRAWENYRREWDAKGEKFYLKDFVPPIVPDEENFAMTPFLAPLFDLRPNRKPGEPAWRDTNAFTRVQDFGKELGSPKAAGSWDRAQRSDLTAWVAALDGKKDAPMSGESLSARTEAAKVVVQKLRKYSPVLEELQAASHRSGCRFNIDYNAEDPISVLIPHLAVLRKLSQMYQLRACAELAIGNPEAALADVKMGLFLVEGTKLEPVLISGLVRIAILKNTLQPVWEGLADRRWSEAQLKDLQQEISKIDLLKGYELTMRGERAFDNGELDYQRRVRRMQNLSDNGDSRFAALNFIPSGWFYQNQIAINKMFQNYALPLIDADKHRVYLDLSTNAEMNLNHEMDSGFMFYTIFARLLFPAVIKAETKFAIAQAEVDQALVACALERFRLAHGQFPETLAALTPQFVENLPPDLVIGEPLIYRRTEDGQFILYSIGWNGTDDGGILMMNNAEKSRVDIAQGDWVWRYPVR